MTTDSLLCLQAVQTRVLALRSVPRALRSPAVCLAAVLAGGDDVIFEVPEKLRTEALCLLSCDPARWSVPGMAYRRTAEALPREFFRKDGTMKRDLAEFFGAREHGREMLLRMQVEDGSFRRLKRQSWREDLALEAAWRSPEAEEGGSPRP